MGKLQMVVAVVVLVCSSLCRCDLASHPLQGLISAMSSDQMDSLKQALGIPPPAAPQVADLTNSQNLPLGSATNVLDTPQAMLSSANTAVNEVTSNMVTPVAEQISAVSNAAAQSQQVADQLAAASNAAAQSQAEQLAASEAASAAQAAQASNSPVITGCGLSLPDGIIPELPLPILSHLLPSMSTLPPHILAQVPPSILAQLPPENLEKLPPSVLSGLPVDALSKLSLPTLSGLPASVLTKLPHSVISHLPADALGKLPTNFLAELPLSTLSELPQNLLSRMVQDILGQLPLPLPMLYQLTNLKQLATPDAISNLLGIIDIFKTISGHNPE